MARKYTYQIVSYKPTKVLGSIRASSYREAELLGSRQFGPNTLPRVQLTPEDMTYLRKITADALASGRISMRDMAWPWFRLKNSKDIDETHSKNIIDAMPTDLQIAYYRANDEWDELRNYEVDDYVGERPVYEIRRLPENKKTPEAYAKIYGRFLAKALRSDFDGFETSISDDAEWWDDILYYVVDNVPRDKFSEELIQTIRKFIVTIGNKNDGYFREMTFESLPPEVFTGNTVFTKALLRRYPSYIFYLPMNAQTLEFWTYALTLGIQQGGFTGEAAIDGADEFSEYMPEQVRNNPRIVELLRQYAESEEKSSEEAGKEWEDETPDSEAGEKHQHADKMPQDSKDGMSISNSNRPNPDSSIDRIKQLAGITKPMNTSHPDE